MQKAFSYKMSIFLFLLPALLLFIGVLIAPIFLSVRDSMYSFSNFTGSDRVFVAFGENDNYLTLFSRYLKDGSTLNTKYIGNALVTAFILAALSTLAAQGRFL